MVMAIECLYREFAPSIVSSGRGCTRNLLQFCFRTAALNAKLRSQESFLALGYRTAIFFKVNERLCYEKAL